MKVSKGTIIRSIMLFFVVLNMALKYFGIKVININESDVSAFVETAVELAVIVVAWWKNNSFSTAAIRADNVLKQIKNNEK